VANVTFNTLDTNHFLIFYKRLMRGYVGLHGASSARDKVFACPADTFYYEWPSLECQTRSLHNEPASDYSSYGFIGNGETNPVPPAFLNQASYGGIAGRRQASISEPARTVLLMEISAGFPWSWHEPQGVPSGQCGFNGAKNVLSFVDGHVSYIKMYRNPNFNLPTCNYEPSPGYDYKWHGD
jgi:hypothetical protein